MKVAIVAVMVVLAMGVAFVGGLLVASKVTAARQERPVEKAPIVAAQVAPKEEAEKGKEGEITKEHAGASKKEPKKATTDEMIMQIDFSVQESRDAGKMLFRKKVAEEMEATEKQFESETEKVKEKERLAASLQRWLDRSKNQ